MYCFIFIDQLKTAFNLLLLLQSKKETQVKKKKILFYINIKKYYLTMKKLH